MEQLSSLATSTQQLMQMLRDRGLGVAGEAILGVPELPPLEAMATAPPPGAPPEVAPAPPAPSAPPAEPVTPPEPEKKDEYKRMQGSVFHIGLMSPKDAFRVLWREWKKAGIGITRNPASSDQTDATGRLRGTPATDELAFVPDVQVVLPGREGSIIVPADHMHDFAAFQSFLGKWGVPEDGRISLQIEGMTRADGPVASRKVWEAPGPDHDEEG